MKTLNTYIKEGILGDLDNVVNNSDRTIKDSIRSFIKENYGGVGNVKISKNPNADGKYVVSRAGNVSIYVKNTDIEYLTNGYFVWGEVGGSFEIDDCVKLKSLEGAPKEVQHYMRVTNCTSLTSLEGAPEKVLKLYINNCNIEDLKGCTQNVCFLYIGFCKNLRSLQGAPKGIIGEFSCRNNPNLESLEYTPNPMTPTSSVDYIFTDNNKITSLKGAPETATRFSCSYCKSLKSLEGAPKKILWGFYCDHCNSLTSLKGAPIEVGGEFSCSFCTKLEDLTGLPKKIGKHIVCKGCKRPFTRDEIRALSEVGDIHN